MQNFYEWIDQLTSYDNLGALRSIVISFPVVCLDTLPLGNSLFAYTENPVPLLCNTG